MALSLAVVVLLIYGAAWLLRRWRGSRPGGAEAAGTSDRLIQIMDRRYLDSKRGLAVVDMGGEVLFLGLGEDVTLLHRVADKTKAEELRQSAASQAFFKGFPQQLERVSSLLRSNQWKKNRQSLKSQAEFVREQTEKLKPLSRGGEE
jgi:flagellar biosynthetic protein FliO